MEDVSLDVHFPEIRFTPHTALWAFLKKLDPRLLEIVDVVCQRHLETQKMKQALEIEATWEAVRKEERRVKRLIPNLKMDMVELRRELRDVVKLAENQDKLLRKWRRKARAWRDHPDMAATLDENRILWIERNAFKAKLKEMYNERRSRLAVR